LSLCHCSLQILTFIGYQIIVPHILYHAIPSPSIVQAVIHGTFIMKMSGPRRGAPSGGYTACPL